MIEQMTEEINYRKGYDKGYSDAMDALAKNFDKAYDKGYNEGWQKNEYQSKWVNIKDEAPETGRRVIYFFDGCGIFIGFYLGIDDSYCPETGHVFGSSQGYLTGDVTHWQYIPQYPEPYNEEFMKADIDYAKCLLEEIEECKKEIGKNSAHE